MGAGDMLANPDRPMQHFQGAAVMNAFPVSPDSTSPPAPTAELSLLRLYLLRLVYLVMAAGIAVYYWPDVISHTRELAVSNGVRTSLLAGLGVVAALGLRYPLKMLPVLIFEFVWKAIYLIAFALPLWRSHQPLEAVAVQDIYSVLMVLVFIPFTPWDYVISNYVMKRGERWK
jgi:hypothetical protein